MKIAEVCEKYGVPVDTLRYYERIGLIPTVNRKSGIRDYNEGDLKWVEFVKCMRNAGLSIEVLIEYVTLSQQGDTTASARKELLAEQRKHLLARMDEMKKTLKRLDYKISVYDSVLSGKEKELKWQ